MSPGKSLDPTRRIRVWDPLIRILHWLLVMAVALAWLSTLIFGWADVHEPAGYVALVVVAIRIVWGFCGGRHARFREFVRAAPVVRRYCRDLLQDCEARYIGHNPLGGWMIVALLLVTLLACLTGWLFTTDTFWGYYWLSLLHAILAWTLLVLIALHIGGVIFASVRQNENLVRAMLTGNKPSVTQHDAQHDRAAG